MFLQPASSGWRYRSEQAEWYVGGTGFKMGPVLKFLFLSPTDFFLGESGIVVCGLGAPGCAVEV